MMVDDKIDDKIIERIVSTPDMFLFPTPELQEMIHSMAAEIKQWREEYRERDWSGSCPTCGTDGSSDQEDWAAELIETVRASNEAIEDVRLGRSNDDYQFPEVGDWYATATWRESRILDRPVLTGLFRVLHVGMSWGGYVEVKFPPHPLIGAQCFTLAEFSEHFTRVTQES